MEHKAKTGELFIVATPIGNLEDITYRAVAVLKAADVIYCEDTRHSRKLSERYAIATPLKPYHEHNASHVRPQLLEALHQGQKIALISDAGTPLISDPGYKLVEEARQQALRVTPLPGACAAITALCASALPSDRFTFIGFLPPKTQARIKAMEQLRHTQSTLIFYESPKRLLAMLRDAIEVFGQPCPATVARELTKSYESFTFGTLQSCLNFYEAAESIKGEVVVLIAPPKKDINYSQEQVLQMLKEAIKTQPLKRAAAEVAELTGQSKRILYQLGLELKDG